MGNSVVDLGAAAVDYASDTMSDFVDYMTGSSEASASGGYFKELGPGARQYFSGPGEDKSSSIMDYIGFDDGGAVEGIMSVDLSKGADTTGPDTMRPIPQYPGIEGFDIYKDLAPEQFKIRPIDKQNFDKKRGFQFGQMVELRDDAVGGKLLKQAGIMTPVDQVKQTVDPKVMDQMSRILGREVV